MAAQDSKIEVRLYSFNEVSNPKTKIWISQKAAKGLVQFKSKDRRLPGQFLKKLERYAMDGFALYRGRDKPVRSEGSGVYRIGMNASLFRLLGFFADDNDAEFIVCDAYLKQGQRLDASDRSRVKSVAKTKESGSWKRMISEK